MFFGGINNYVNNIKDIFLPVLWPVTETNPQALLV